MRTLVVERRTTGTPPWLVLTCPHAGCAEPNDPGAYAAARELHARLVAEGVATALLAGSTDRHACDLNRAECDELGIASILRDARALVDVHSYPRGGGAFDGATGLVCLTPKDVATTPMTDRLAAAGATVIAGGANHLINIAHAKGVPAALVEFPYPVASEDVATVAQAFSDQTTATVTKPT